MLVAFSGDYGGVWIRGLRYARGDIFSERNGQARV